MGYIYSNANIKQFAKNPNATPGKKTLAATIAASVATTFAIEVAKQVAWMITNNISKSIASGDVEKWFIQLKNSGKLDVRKNLAEAKKAKKELKAFSEVTTDKLEVGQTIRHQALGTEFLITNIKEKTPNTVTLTYQFVNPEMFDLDDPKVKEPSDITLDAKTMKQFYRVA